MSAAAPGKAPRHGAACSPISQPGFHGVQTGTGSETSLLSGSLLSPSPPSWAQLLG